MMEDIGSIIKDEFLTYPTNQVFASLQTDQLIDEAFTALELGNSEEYHRLMQQAKIAGKMLSLDDPRNPDNSIYTH